MNELKEKLKVYDEIIRYVVVGVITTVVSLGSYYFCVLFLFDPNSAFLLQCSNIISWILSVSFAFFANRKYVFKSTNDEIFNEGLKFYSSRLITLFVDMFVMWLTVTVFRLNDKIMKIFSNIIILILNYIISKFIVFVKVVHD